MGGRYSVTLREPIIGYPIDTWDRKIDYITKQIDEKGLNDNNISGLECGLTKKDGRLQLTFFESRFDALSHLFKDLKPMYRSTESFAQVFKADTTSQVFYPKTLEIDEEKMLMFTPPALYQNPELSMNNIVSTINGHLSNGHSLNVGSPKYIEFNNDMNIIYESCTKGKTVCALAYFQKDGVYHAVALIFWMHGDKLNCGIYDPMYYVREHEGFKHAYIWAIHSFAYCILKFSKYHGIPVKLSNFSELCHRSPKGIHCAQYMINAEYCMIYSLYFIYLYASHGYPKSVSGMQSVINATFVSDPAELKRNPCKATNRFRLILMSFILNVMHCLTDDPPIHREMLKIYDLTAMDGYKLLDEETYAEILREFQKNTANYNAYLRRKEDYLQKTQASNIKGVLNMHPNYLLLEYPSRIVLGRKYKVIYRNKNSSVKQYNGMLIRHNEPRGSFTLKANSNVKLFDMKNVIGISQRRRGGRQNKTRRIGR